MDPITLSREIEARYKRYLQTTFYFRDPELRASFERALDSGRLSRGPYLESTPVFKQADPPNVLFPQLLGQALEQRFLNALQADRPLYQHQAKGIRQVFDGHNVIIATGTGSGKTEAFLYPILLHLYREFQAGTLGPGVRALILYPMNALANDQRDRLGEIVNRLAIENSPFRFTFGQYIGETPEDTSDSRRHAKEVIADREKKGFRQVRDGKVVCGELVLRSEMRQEPPHILLTNYSMLEYLLLRPDDSPLFDDGMARWWTFLVLDEAHQYRGSRGMEMAMLIARLKQRLREGGRRDPFRCIATSATLVEGAKDSEAVAQFATDLFGEPFDKDNVLLGEVASFAEPSTVELSRDDYAFLTRIADTGVASDSARLTHLFERLGASSRVNLAQTLGAPLQRDRRVARLRQLLVGNPMPVQDLADQIFPDVSADRITALAELVNLLLHAQDPQTGASLLSVRYHLFCKSLEGAFLSYLPEKQIGLDRQATDGQTFAFEVALCRQCGQHYLIAQKNLRSQVAEPTRDPSQLGFGVTFLRPVEDEGDLVSEDSDGESTDKPDVRQLCVQCGAIARDKPTCGHRHFIQVIVEASHDNDDKADQLKRCSACGYTAAGRDPVREVVYGADGPHVVIATTLFQHLPTERKKVLAFADGRQEAAFFAWYLEESYKDILHRNQLLKIAASFSDFPTEGIGLATIVDRALQNYREAFTTQESDDAITVRKNIWRALYREFLTEEQRLSLEGVGLISWSIQRPRWFGIPDVLRNPPWSLSEMEAWHLITLLLDSMRVSRAIDLRTPSGIPLNWGDLEIEGLPKQFVLGQPKKQKNAVSWDGENGRRFRLLIKLLSQSMSQEAAYEQARYTLRALWQYFRECDENAPSPQDRLLMQVNDGRRLNPNWWRLQRVGNESALAQCDVCGHMQAFSVRDVCSRDRCTGTLKPIRPDALPANHYRELYQENLPHRLRVEEHTAQLDYARAREYQKDFREGKIHVLSCSTTFELGVDLGDLDTTFLRNVPPESFNYAQRVGRVGRRRGFPGFAITFCRRNPHDLYHFEEPKRMIIGQVKPPILGSRNEKIIVRHIAATALSAFFRHSRERFANVATFFDDLEHPVALADLNTFLEENRSKLEGSLRAIVPSKSHKQVGLDDGGWITTIAGSDSRLALAEIETSGDYVAVRRLRQAAFERDDNRTVSWAGARAKTIAEEDVLAFLSRKAVIPKYGFPVDVVELDTQRTQQEQANTGILLQRDLSIAVSEFAPTSELIANKKVWTSYGLKKVVEKEWGRWWYARCPTHARFERALYHPGERQPKFEECCDKMVVHQYIEPQFGFVTGREKPKEPHRRPDRVFTTRPYFSGFRQGEGERVDLDVMQITRASPGYMIVLCEGRRGEGFYVCPSCGAGFRQRRDLKGHLTPYGEKCSANIEAILAASLGHELLTDVLKLQFCRNPETPYDRAWFPFALGYALVEGAAEVLQVPVTDLSVTVAYAEPNHTIAPIVLYDNVPGGAGLVARLEDKETLQACLESAFERVGGKCGCGDNASCYGCLRNYRNQFAHPFLQRGPVRRYLEGLLAEWK